MNRKREKTLKNQLRLARLEKKIVDTLIYVQMRKETLGISTKKLVDTRKDSK